MQIIIEPGVNGYDIRTPECLRFDLGDVEAWEYVGLSGDVTEMLARGFPIWWEESGEAKKANREPAELAAESRAKHLSTLAVYPLLQISSDPPLARLYRDLKWIADGNRPGTKPGEVPYAFYIGSKLEARKKAAYERELKEYRKPLTVSFEQWNEAARQLFDALRHPNNPGGLRPHALQVAVKKRMDRPGTPPVERGTRLARQHEVAPHFAKSEKNQIQWGPFFYPFDAVKESHFAVMGLPRMGKTTLLRLLFQSFHDSPTVNARFVFYDAKADLLPKLYPPEFFDNNPTQQEIDRAVYLLNPLDERCTGWNIAADAKDAASAVDVAAALFPVLDKHMAHRYFRRAMQEISVAVMDALTRKAGGPKWTFFDLLCGIHRENVKDVLKTTQYGRRIYNEYLADPGPTQTDTFRSISEVVGQLLPFARHWRKAKRTISLREWVNRDPKSIVLMTPGMAEEPLRSINSFLLGMLARIHLANDQHGFRTFMYLDEFERLGRIDALIRASQQGSSKNLTLALCLHDIELLREKYGDMTEGVLGLCDYWAFLRINSRHSAEWASQYIGNREITSTEVSEHFDDKGERSGHTHGKRTQLHRLVLADEFKALPAPVNSKKISAYFATPLHPRYFGQQELSQLYAPSVLWPTAKQVAKYIGPDLLPPVEDIFESLHALGFRREGSRSSPTQHEPPIRLEHSHTPAAREPHEEQMEDNRRRVRSELEDMDIDFGIDH